MDKGAPAGNLFEDPWDTSEAVNGQQALALKELSDWLAGKPHASFDPACELLGIANGLDPIDSLAEVGCALGYMAAVFANRFPGLVYTGWDTSFRMIERAKALAFTEPERYSVVSPDVQPFPDNSFDVVMIGACLGHASHPALMLDAARSMARKFVLVHKTLLRADAHPNPVTIEKVAYGVKMREWAFTRGWIAQQMGDPLGKSIIDVRIWSQNPTGTQCMESILFKV